MKSWLRAFTLGLAGLASFAIFTLAVRALVPLDPSYGLRAKFEAFADERDEFDAVYLGSSLSFRAYQPVVIDKVVSRSGPPFRSFNLAMAGVVPYEADLLLDRVIATHSKRLSWIVMELPRWGDTELKIKGKRLLTQRVASWHTPRSMLSFARVVARAEDLGPQDKLDVAATHAVLFGRWLGNVGFGPVIGRAVAEVLDREHVAAVSTMKVRRGYESLESIDDDETRDRRRIFEISASAYVAQPEARWSAQTRRRGESAWARYDRAALIAQEKRIERAGLRVVYVDPPGLLDDAFGRRVAEAGLVRRMLDFNRPDQYPQLYKVRNRFDGSHLSASGARLFSQTFADAFLPFWLEGALKDPSLAEKNQKADTP